jgi:endonuclease V-like protein UPF0215 family
VSGAKQSILGGVVMRADLIIDGITYGKATVREMDATDAIIAMVRHLSRDDLNGIMLHGSVIAGYNIVDLPRVHQMTQLPVISITKEPHEDLQTHLETTFPSDWEKRWEIACRNGTMKPLALNTTATVFVQFFGCDWDTVKGVLKRLTRFGGVPEPIRIARLLARALVTQQTDV